MKLSDTISYHTNKSEYQKAVYERNKHKYLKKIDCKICGGSYCLYNKNIHLKSKKHLKCLEIIKNI